MSLAPAGKRLGTIRLLAQATKQSGEPVRYLHRRTPKRVEGGSVLQCIALQCRGLQLTLKHVVLSLQLLDLGELFRHGRLCMLLHRLAYYEQWRLRLARSTPRITGATDTHLASQGPAWLLSSGPGPGLGLGRWPQVQVQAAAPRHGQAAAAFQEMTRRAALQAA